MTDLKAKLLRVNEENDIRKHDHVGEIGGVVSVENDYQCFSRVTVQFDNGDVIECNNTELEDVTNGDQK